MAFGTSCERLDRQTIEVIYIEHSRQDLLLPAESKKEKHNNNNNNPTFKSLKDQMTIDELIMNEDVTDDSKTSGDDR